MRREEDITNIPQRWLDNARADLALARSPLPSGGLYEHLCFHAQQAAEKSLKAVLITNNITFPFTHNLQILIDLLPSGYSIPQMIYDSVILTPYAVTTRYPGESEPVDEKEYLETVKIAEAVLEWAQSMI